MPGFIGRSEAVGNGRTGFRAPFLVLDLLRRRRDFGVSG
jgi:hypothetical protein